jgi:CelD/BcsL family acetyltransferase involved in cellulose biosynthesis
VHASALQIRVVDSAAGFAALAGAWESLQKDASPTSIFASFDWQEGWWRFYGRGEPLKLLVASDGDQIVGILPLWVHTVPMLKFPVRLLRFVGSGGDTFPDDLGPILARGREIEVARALAGEVLRLPGWDVLLLTDMDPACAFTSAIAEACGRDKLLQPQTGRSERIAFAQLPESYDAWLGSLHRDRRYRIKNIRKKLYAKHPDARFFVWTDPATLDAGVDRLVWLHKKRWEGVGTSYSFSSPEYIGFHRTAMKALLAKDRLRLYCLEIGGQVIAMFYFYRFRDHVFLMQSGFDPDFGDVKPGQVLLGHIVESAIGEKMKVLDFLRGDHRYKDELASGERETRFLTAFRATHPGSWVYRARRQVLPTVKAELLKIVRKVRPPAPEAKTT